MALGTANTKVVTSLTTASNVVATDQVLVVYNASGNTSLGNTGLRLVTVTDLSKSLLISNTVPSTSSSNGVKGTFCFDTSYFYVCVANNTWKRTALTTW